MSIDRYTKIILTVIAPSLALLAGQQVVKSAFGDIHFSCNKSKEIVVSLFKASDKALAESNRHRLAGTCSDKFWRDVFRQKLLEAGVLANFYTPFCKP